MATSKRWERLYVALVHYPVLNRRDETIASAVTNLDLHDLGRAACTYGLGACYIVTPLRDQQALSAQLLAHWCEGVGRELHPDREMALRSLRVVESIEAARGEIEAQWGVPPVVWATTAKEDGKAIGYREARGLLDKDSRPHLLLLGTGWGLHPSVVDGADGVLAPVRGENGYNHLSVRCAAAIIMDRLISTDR